MTNDIRTILVPHDFSTGSSHALEYAQMMARRFGASLHLVHVCELPSLMTVSMDGCAMASSDWSQRLGDAGNRELVQIAAGIEGIKASTEVLFGNPAHAIVTAARTSAADLIVMGTHGHGPIAHLVMGNVAERVVRTASCPVLTVRESRTAEWHKPRTAPRAAAVMAAVSAAVLLSLVGVARADAQTAPEPTVVEMTQRVTGRATFQTYCVTCHGSEGRGDGRLAAHMKRKPANLTEIARRNGGEFPTELVYRTIDGSQPVRGHSGPDMPAWGEMFLKSREGGAAADVRLTIDSLVRFIESIQAKQAP